MSKFLLGLLLGTLLGFVIARSLRDDAIESTSSSDPSTENTATSRLATGSEPKTAGAVAMPMQTSPQSASPSVTQAGSSRSDAGIAPSELTTTMPAALQDSLAQAAIRRDAHQAATAQPRTPIALPEEIKPFLEQTDTHDGLTLGQTHTKLEDESEDYAWAYQMELYLRQFLLRPTKSGQPLDVRVIECRATMCEIVGFSTLANPMDDLGPILQQMSQQPWWDFDKMNSTAAGDGTGGKFLLFLRRKRS